MSSADAIQRWPVSQGPACDSSDARGLCAPIEGCSGCNMAREAARARATTAAQQDDPRMARSVRKVQREFRRAAKAARKSKVEAGRALLATRLRRGAFWPGQSCPHQGVEAFRDEEDAWLLVEMIASKRALYTGTRSAAPRAVEVVDCECGFWHVTMNAPALEPGGDAS
jgi:hypothetical protein